MGASKSGLLTLGGIAGIAAPLLMWSAFVVAAPLRPGYDLLRDPTSELGQIGSPGAAVFNLGFFLLPGLLVIAFGAALALLPAQPWARLTASLMISVCGLSIFASGLLPMAPNSGAETFWHRFAGLPLLTLLPSGILLLSLVFASQSAFRSYGWLCLIAGSGLTILIGCYRLHLIEIPDGTFQRLSLAILTPWLVGIGLLLLRLKDPGRRLAEKRSLKERAVGPQIHEGG